MMKLAIGFFLATAFLCGLIYIPHFTNYYAWNFINFGLNNIGFLLIGISLGGLGYREFCTEEEK
tara:strand:+ start:855 stop:1046 length:192 start_codon:yes stop_codon:yes gene_type:complete